MEHDVWSVGEAYEAYVGRWSRAVAVAFLRWLDLPAGRGWADVGCGTGALTAAVLAEAAPRELVGIDPAEGFLAAARVRVTDSRVRLLRGDARALPLPDRSRDAVVSGLALNFVPDPDQALAEFARVAVPGGVVAAYVWDYAGRMELIQRFWEVATVLDPAAARLDEGHRFPLCRPDPLRELWIRAGLRDVDVLALDVPTVFTDFDDYWTPFLGGQGPAPGYVMSLSEEHRRALRDALRVRLPVDADGSIRLTARAWAVRGNA